MSRKRARHEICSLDELPIGERKIVEIGKRSIGVFNVHGEYYAIRNICPHQGAELCRGSVGGTMLPTDTPGEYNYSLDGRILRCPWHFWEFDITTGEMIFVPNPKRVQTFDVAVEKPTLERYDVNIEEDVVVVYL
ncbi:MAG: Rieske (2Fe-2S) protein [Chloroflexota bacterium]